MRPGFSLYPSILLLMSLALACHTAPPARLQPLSARADMVSGGDVLLGLHIPAPVNPTDVKVTMGDRDLTPLFRTAPAAAVSDANLRTALVDQLPAGASTITVSWQKSGVFGGKAHDDVSLTNHAITGPIISGPHEKPFICQTQAFELQNGEMLGPPLDENCSVKTRIDYVYRTRDGDTLPWPAEGPRPGDIALATTTEGHRVPFIIRIQTGTVNRAIYQSAMLHDPATPTPDPWTRSAGWNGRLVYTHGGGCRRGWYKQGDRAGSMRSILLERGYAVTSSSLNVFGQNCNDLLASETHIMVKERFIESYGVPLFTIGTGGSGGSYQSHQTADNYPGIFDGILVEASFPDVTTASIFTMADARLLLHYFEKVDTFTPAQQQAISGFPGLQALKKNASNAARIVAIAGPDDGDGNGDGDGDDDDNAGGEFPDVLPDDEKYHPELRPGGARPTVYDHTANVYRDPATGKVGRPLDNVGVEYGLAALNAGLITFQQFLDLNRRIGGFDPDGRIVAARSVADAHAARQAHSTGRILFGGAGLATTPVIDLRSYQDDNPKGDVHLFVHQFSTRARLQAANGHIDNHVMVVRPREPLISVNSEAPGPSDGPSVEEREREEARDEQARRTFMPLLASLDAWLTAIVQDRSQASPVEKMRRARPVDLVDHCWEGEGPAAIRHAQPITADGAGKCGTLFPIHWTPRHIAGAPIANDVVKCQRKPIDGADYKPALTQAQQEQLAQVFPGGVCDYTKPGQYAGHGGTWQSLP